MDTNPTCCNTTIQSAVRWDAGHDVLVHLIFCCPTILFLLRSAPSNKLHALLLSRELQASILHIVRFPLLVKIKEQPAATAVEHFGLVCFVGQKKERREEKMEASEWPAVKPRDSKAAAL